MLNTCVSTWMWPSAQVGYVKVMCGIVGVGASQCFMAFLVLTITNESLYISFKMSQLLPFSSIPYSHVNFVIHTIKHNNNITCLASSVNWFTSQKSETLSFCYKSATVMCVCSQVQQWGLYLSRHTSCWYTGMTKYFPDTFTM